MSFQYRCFRDICDAAWQYCDEREQRCSACTNVHCGKVEAEKIFNQCKNKCEEWMNTTIVIPNSTSMPSQVCPSTTSHSLQDLTVLILLTVIIALLVCVILFLIKIFKQRQKCTGCSTESLFVQRHGGYQPLMKNPVPDNTRYDGLPTDTVKLPVQINTEMVTGRANNMMHDAEILNEAIVGRNEQDVSVPLSNE